MNDGRPGGQVIADLCLYKIRITNPCSWPDGMTKPSSPLRYRTTNWSSFSASLRTRGSL